MHPKMFVVAGPPGGGKSTVFPVPTFGVDSFNADDRAAQLNQGSYLDIRPGIREQVNRIFEAFVTNHIARRASLAFETSLRSAITFDQADEARRAGFVVEMRYIALHTFALHVERVRMRADAGGHSAPVARLREIYEASLANLARAIHEMDFIHVYDNSRFGGAPTLLLQAARGQVVYHAERLPDWLVRALS